MLYEERTGSLPFQKQIVAFMLKIPGLKSYVKQKQAISREKATEIVSEGQAYLSSGLFLDVGTERELNAD